MKEFNKYINKYNLIDKNDKIVIAFSGGPDSVFLFLMLNEIKEKYNLQIILVYINHNIRDDVNKDIDIVKKYGRQYDIPVIIKEIRLEKFSENDARDARYKIFNDIMLEYGYNKIATGHNKNDNVETILFRMIRGTSINGLKGIPNKNGNIIRPILFMEKSNILNYLNDNNHKYVIDYTNNENNYSRNKIRNKILPIMNEINSKSIDNINNLIIEINNEKEYEEKEKIREKLQKYDIEINKKKIDAIYSLINKKNGNKSIELGNGYIWYQSYDKGEILKREDEITKFENHQLEIDKEYIFNDYFIKIIKKADKNSLINILEKNNVNDYNIYNITNEYNKNKIYLRNRMNGDRILLKNIGYKKIKDIFINIKLDIKQRNTIPIISNDTEVLLMGNVRYSMKIHKLSLENISYNDIILLIGGNNKNEK